MRFSTSNLKLVPRDVEYGMIPVSSLQGVRDAHSLHRIALYPHSAHIELVSEILSRFSSKEDRILDPFCGYGSVVRETALNRRVAIGVDNDPLCVRISRSSLFPVDLVEVTLALQMAVSKIPVDSAIYEEYFDPFFHLSTFSELMSLKRAIKSSSSDALQYIEALVLSLLHGKGAGYFTFSHSSAGAVSPVVRREANKREDSTPDYRAVVPRLLRRTSQIMQDRIPSHLLSYASRSRIALADVRNLSNIGTASIDLVVTNPPIPSDSDLKESMWIKRWFAGVSDPVEQSVPSGMKESSWLQFMNEALLELARVTKTGKFCALIVRKWAGHEEVAVQLQSMVEQDLGRYWNCHALYHAVSGTENVQQSEAIWQSMKHKRDGALPSVVVLRRK